MHTITGKIARQGNIVKDGQTTILLMIATEANGKRTIDPRRFTVPPKLFAEFVVAEKGDDVEILCEQINERTVLITDGFVKMSV